MASFLDKFKLTTAIDKNTSLDLSCEHITTSDWCHSAPVYIKEMVPGETLKVHQETFTRMASLVVPTYGRALVHNRAFFVPMRTLFKQWDEFITAANSAVAATQSSSPVNTVLTISSVPFMTNRDLVGLFCTTGNNVPSKTNVGNTIFARNVVNSQSGNWDTQKDKCDFILADLSTDNNRVDYGFNFTDLGRRVYKILSSLGYQPIWQITPAGEENIANNFKVSALPLLSWFRIMIDWYYASQYVGDSDYLYVKSLLDNIVTSGTTGTQISYITLRQLFGASSSDNIFNGLVNYDSDYFVSAFDYPNNASVGGIDSNNYMIKDINYNNGSNYTANPLVLGEDFVGSTVRTNGVVPTLKVNGSSNTAGGRVTQYGLDALKALTDYAKRHQLVGARALDRFYARFGKSLDAAKLDRSYYIGGDNIPLQFSDVMSHTDSNGTYLGDYAGKGLAYGSNGNYEYTTDEYGFFVVISSIVPKVGYYQGMDRSVLHLGRLDYWTPEFDQLGNQAISSMELYAPNNANVDNVDNEQADFITVSYPDQIFGWTPRYSEYKVGRDKLTGDFRCNSKSAAGDTSSAWHLYRNVGENFQGASSVVHGRYFVSGYDSGQYNRLFNNDEGSSDKFYMIHHFDVLSESPMHSLYDTYKFENEGEAKTVVADVNGVKVN